MPDDTALPQSQAHSQLFTLRLWHDAEQTDQRAPYMQVRHVLSAETRFLRDWTAVTAYMMSKLDSPYSDV